MNFLEFLEQILPESQVVAFGETHHGTHAKIHKLLTEELEKFNGIFDEIPINYQPLIDNYLKTGKFDRELERLIEGALKEGKNIRDEWVMILDAAREKHLPVICIDSSKVQTPLYNRASDPDLGRYFLKGKSRDEDMFAVVQNNLEKSDGKWCLTGENQHIKYGINFRSGDVTLGSKLKQLLGNGFYNICLWKLNDGDLDIIEGETECFDVRSCKIDPKLQQLMLKYKFNVFNEDNRPYFDGYIFHS